MIGEQFSLLRDRHARCRTEQRFKRKTNASLVVEENHVEIFLAKFDGRLRGTRLCSEAEFWIGEGFSS
jgi:hypothetical protein